MYELNIFNFLEYYPNAMTGEVIDTVGFCTSLHSYR